MHPCSLEKCFSCRGGVLRVFGEATNSERAFRDVLSILLQFLHFLKYFIFLKCLNIVKFVTKFKIFKVCSFF